MIRLTAPSVRRWREIARLTAQSFAHRSEPSGLHLTLAIVDANANQLHKIGFNGPLFKDEIVRALKARSRTPVDPYSGASIDPDALEILLTDASKAAKEFGDSRLMAKHILLGAARGQSTSAKILRSVGLHPDLLQNALKAGRLTLDFEDGLPAMTMTLNWDAVLLTAIGEAGFHVLIDPGEASLDDVADVFAAISELNRAIGGEGMTFVDSPDESKVLTGEIA